MRVLPTLSLLLLLLCVRASAQEDEPDKLYAAEDFTPDEPPGADKLIADLDTNNDGKISYDEMKGRFTKWRRVQLKMEAKEAPSEEDQRKEDEEIISQALSDPDADGGDPLGFSFTDKNRDGKVTEEEVVASIMDEHNMEDPDNQSPMPEWEKEVLTKHERLRFAAADSDGDGSLTRKEFALFRSKLYPHVDEEMIHDWATLETKHAFKQHDTNDDSHLDRGEVEKAHDDLWYQTHPPGMHDEL